MWLSALQVLYIRDKLSSDDYGTVLQPLMRYPAVGDVRDVFATAMALRAGACVRECVLTAAPHAWASSARVRMLLRCIFAAGCMVSASSASS